MGFSIETDCVVCYLIEGCNGSDYDVDKEKRKYICGGCLNKLLIECQGNGKISVPISEDYAVSTIIDFKCYLCQKLNYLNFLLICCKKHKGDIKNIKGLKTLLDNTSKYDEDL